MVLLCHTGLHIWVLLLLSLSTEIEGRQCRVPHIENGRIESTGDLQLGAEITFLCEHGYRLRGQNTARCVVSGSTVDWNREPPYCQIIPCFPPPKITNGEHSGIDGDEYVFGTAVTYKCDAGFSLIGNESIYCTTAENGVDGEWSGPAPECKDVKCERPTIQNGRVAGVFQAIYTYDNNIKIECDAGCTLLGSNYIKCGADNLWHPAVPTCAKGIFPPTVHPGGDTDIETKADCGRPDPVPYATLTRGELKDSYPKGTVLRYRCIPGYENIPGTTPSIQCLDTEWSKGPAFCRGRQCRPPDIENGRIILTGDLRLGDEITFACDKGYRLIGQNTARCLVSGSTVDWNREPPYCQQILCFPPPKITNGGHSGDDRDEYLHGTAVTYKCDAGFSLIGKPSISCTVAENGVDGEWSPAAPECKDVQCKRPGIQNGRVASVFQSTYTYDHGIRIACDRRYAVVGSDFIKCGADSLWHPAIPTCVRTDCGRPDPVPYATPTSGELKDSYPVGTILQYRCIPGYENVPGTTLSIKCLDSGWSKGPAFCQRRPCRPPGIENGRIVSKGGLWFGDVVTFTCEQGYRLLGKKTARCVVSGSMVDWNPKPPYCQQILCFPPPKITNGGHSGDDRDEYVYGTAVTYKCDAGFSLLGNASISCTTAENGVEGEWSGPAPACRADCGRPDPVPYATLTSGELKDSYPVGTVLQYRCNPGYENVPGTTLSIKCLDPGWSKGPAFCQRMQCQSPKIENSSIVSTGDHQLLAEISFACEQGYRVIGLKSVNCVVIDNTVYCSRNPPYCQLIPCFAPPKITNGRHSGNGDEYLYGTTVTYKCDAGFSLIGNPSITCTSAENGVDGKWSGPVPECKGIFTPTVHPGGDTDIETRVKFLEVRLSIVEKKLDHIIHILTTSGSQQARGGGDRR